MIKNKNISIGIFTCESLKKECEILKATFLRHFNNYLFFSSVEDLEMPCYTNSKVEGDDYNSALSKQFLLLKTQYEIHKSCDWFYVGGVDIFIHPENACNLLLQFDHRKEMYVGGHYDHRVIDGKSICFGSGGPGFFLSKKTLERIYPRLEQYIDLWKDIAVRGEYTLYAGCDVAIAYFLKTEFNIELTKCSGFYHFNFYEYINANKDVYPEGNHLHYELISHPVVFHNLKPAHLVEDLYQRAITGNVPFNNCNKLQVS